MQHTLPFSLSLALVLALSTMPTLSHAQPADVNYDESMVPAYELPHPLVAGDGTRIATPEQWWEVRRPEILNVFERQVFGRSPNHPDSMRFDVVSVDGSALGGTATRKQVRIELGVGGRSQAIDLLLYLPNRRTGPAPVVLALNFGGNHTVHADPGIALTRTYEGPDGPVVASERGRGVASIRWPIEAAIARGYGVATAFYGDIDPDFDDFSNGVHALFYEPGQTQPGPDEWGAISAWAWGLRRIMDYLETDPDVEEEEVALMGHSRLGKTALWAGALDARFNFVISNDSGEGGAAITRRRFGETIEHINTRFPHWFADNYVAFNGREDDLPVDAHLLLALIAPRPVYVASAEDDQWADPRGEFLAALHADPAYRLLTGEGLAVENMPPVEQPVLSRIGYHIRRGGHDVTAYDWERWMDWLDLHR